MSLQTATATPTTKTKTSKQVWDLLEEDHWKHLVTCDRVSDLARGRLIATAGSRAKKRTRSIPAEPNSRPEHEMARLTFQMVVRIRFGPLSEGARARTTMAAAAAVDDTPEPGAVPEPGTVPEPGAVPEPDDESSSLDETSAFITSTLADRPSARKRVESNPVLAKHILGFLGTSACLAMRHYDTKLPPVNDAEAHVSPIDVSNRIAAFIVTGDCSLSPRYLWANQILSRFRGRGPRLEIPHKIALKRMIKYYTESDRELESRIVVADFMKLVDEVHDKLDLLTRSSIELLRYAILRFHTEIRSMYHDSHVSLAAIDWETSDSFQAVWAGLGLPSLSEQVTLTIRFFLVSTVFVSSSYYRTDEHLKQLFMAFMENPLLRHKFFPLFASLPSSKVDSTIDRLVALNNNQNKDKFASSVISLFLEAQCNMTGHFCSLVNEFQIRLLLTSSYWTTAEMTPNLTPLALEYWVTRMIHNFESEAVDFEFFSFIQRKAPYILERIDIDAVKKIHLQDIAIHFPSALDRIIKCKSMEERYYIAKTEDSPYYERVRLSIIEAESDDILWRDRFLTEDIFVWLSKIWRRRELKKHQAIFLLKCNKLWLLDATLLVRQLVGSAIRETFRYLIGDDKGILLRRGDQQITYRKFACEFLDAVVEYRHTMITPALQELVTTQRRVLTELGPMAKKLLFIKRTRSPPKTDDDNIVASGSSSAKRHAGPRSSEDE